MSTDTQTSAPDFVAAKARELPTIACTGYIDEVGEVKATSGGDYAIFRINLVGTRGSRGQGFNFMFRPEWFDVGYNPEVIGTYDFPETTEEETKKKRNGMLSVYRRNIAPQSGLSALKGLTGSEDNWKVFLQRREETANRIAAERPDDPTFNEEDVHAMLTSFWSEDCPGQEIGFVLKQGSEKTDQVDERGKVIYQKTDRHEVDSFFFVEDEKQVKALVQRAARSKDGKFIIGFELE
jgi:hypothetical protein